MNPFCNEDLVSLLKPPYIIEKVTPDSLGMK